MRRPGMQRRQGARRLDLVPLRASTKVWWRIALQSFGGPAGQIAVMHRELVEQRRWFGEGRFLHALSYCTLLPGPEAQQLAIYLGWLLNGTAGGLIAGTLFVLPGFVAIMALSVLYVGWGDTPAVTALFAGIAPAVLAIVAHAVLRLSKRALRNRFLMALAVGAFVALAAFAVPFPIVVFAAGVSGFLIARWRPSLVDLGEQPHAHGRDGTPPLIPDDALHGEKPSWRRASRVLLIGLTLWMLPIAVAGAFAGRDSVFTAQGLFFSGAALVTFGGAYAVLSYVAQQAVDVHGWLEPGEMITGLAMAESTPGPLIQVVQFVGFMGAYDAPGGLDPWLAAVLAALLVTWVTFVPCFLFIFLGAPHVEALRHDQRLSSALAGITAAVVGVIANLALFFALHTLFAEVSRTQVGPLRLNVPELATFQVVPAAVAVLAFFLLFQLRWSVLRTLGVCTAVGATAHLLLG